MRVKVIARRGAAAVVEWTAGGETQRSIVPAEGLSAEAAGTAECPSPELGAPYGEPWAEMIRLTATPEKVEAALHQYGIWTAEDLQKHHVRALSAIQSLYAEDLGALLRATRQEKETPHG